MIELGFGAEKGIATMGATDMRHPKIGTSGIKDHLKGLRRRTNRYGAVVLGVGVIFDRFGFTLS
jgi:hypothetical protein